MAANQRELDQLSIDISKSNSEMYEKVVEMWNDIINWFNKNWGSPEGGQKCADDVLEAIKASWANFEQEMAAQSKGIITALENENGSEGGGLNFPGIKTPSFSLNSTTNQKLPDGSIGKREGADITELNGKVQTLRDLIEGQSKVTASIAEGSSAFDSSVIRSLVSSLQGIGADIVSKFTALAESASTRFNNEQSHRVEMEDVNKSNVDVMN